MSEKRNKIFLLAINNILGGRKKHPWGKGVGLKNTRINDIFDGKVPSADALLKIHKAEKARVDYLLTGEGPPYSVPDIRNDEECSELLAAFLEMHGWKVYLLVAEDSGSMLVVLTRAARDEYENGDVAHYTQVEVLPFAGRDSLELLKPIDNCQMVSLDDSTIERLSRGWLGPLSLLGDDENPGLLSTASSLTATALQGSIESLASGQATPKDEAEMLSSYRRLNQNEKEALRTIAKTMSKKSHDVMQAPPGGIVDPDTKRAGGSKRKGDASSVDRKKSTTNKV